MMKAKFKIDELVYVLETFRQKTFVVRRIIYDGHKYMYEDLYTNQYDEGELFASENDRELYILQRDLNNTTEEINRLTTLGIELDKALKRARKRILLDLQEENEE